MRIFYTHNQIEQFIDEYEGELVVRGRTVWSPDAKKGDEPIAVLLKAGKEYKLF